MWSALRTMGEKTIHTNFYIPRSTRMNVIDYDIKCIRRRSTILFSGGNKRWVPKFLMKIIRTNEFYQNMLDVILDGMQKCHFAPPVFYFHLNDVIKDDSKGKKTRRIELIPVYTIVCMLASIIKTTSESIHYAVTIISSLLSTSI